MSHVRQSGEKRGNDLKVLGVHEGGGSSPPSPISKPQLRAFASRLARERPVGLRDSASSEIQRIVLSSAAWHEAERVLCYVALPSEVDTAGLLAAARGRGLPLGVPRVAGREIEFCSVPASDSGFVRSALGVLEPTPAALRLDLSGGGRTLVLVPGLFFDVGGYRLGRGGGHYDRLLARLRLLPEVEIVGLCFDELLLESLPRDPWDQPMDAVVTERRGLLECGPRRRRQHTGDPTAP